MESGIKFTLEKVVTNEMTARNMASGTLDVFATPSMIERIKKGKYNHFLFAKPNLV